MMSKCMMILIFFVSTLTFSASTSDKQDNAKVKGMTTWEIHGAMAAKNRSKGWSATLNWFQSGPNAYKIRLMGPLGNGSVLISKVGNTVTFQSGRKRTSSKSAEELLLKQTGIRLPVHNLFYWVRGLPAPGPIQTKVYDKGNHLLHLAQSGYSIEFNNYSSYQGIDLPNYIRLQGNGLMVKVIIKRWYLKV